MLGNKKKKSVEELVYLKHLYATYPFEHQMKTVDLLSRKLHIKFYRQFCGFQGASNYLGVKFIFTDWVLIRVGVSEAAGFGGMAGIWTRRPKAGTRVPALTCSTEYYSFFGLELFLVTAHELFADIL